MASGEKKLSQLTVLNYIPSDLILYGIRSSGTPQSYGFSREALFNMIQNSSSFANLFTTPLNMTRSGQNIAVPADRTWNILGVQYTNPSSVTRTVSYAASGKTRIDLLVADTNGDFVLIAGPEVTLPASPSAPPLPYLTLQATLLVVTDSSVSNPVEPSAFIYYGQYEDQEDFDGRAPRGVYGAFAFIETPLALVIYNGTDWVEYGKRQIKQWNAVDDGDHTATIDESGNYLLFYGTGVEIDYTIPDGLFDVAKGVELQGTVDNTKITIVSAGGVDSVVIDAVGKKIKYTAHQIEQDVWSIGLTTDVVVKKQVSFNVFQVDDDELTLEDAIGVGSATHTSVRNSGGDFTVTFDLPVFAGAKDQYFNVSDLKMNLIYKVALSATYAYYYWLEDDYTIRIITSEYPIIAPSDYVLEEPQQIKIEL